MQQQLIALHPMPFATITTRLLPVTSVISVVLVAHCLWLLLRDFPDRDQHSNFLLRAASLLRVVAVFPRPYAWWYIYCSHAEARRQPSPILVAQRCLRTSRNPWVRVDERLAYAYALCWLPLLLLVLAARRYVLLGAAATSQYERSLFVHVVACFGAFMLQKIMGVCGMMLIINLGEAELTSHKEVLERASAVEDLTREMEADLRDDVCVICFDSFKEGETCRRLSRCTHTFHQNCIDTWLLKHKLRTAGSSSMSITCP
eukprot:2399345-Prymnesium_polylepis.1